MNEKVDPIPYVIGKKKIIKEYYDQPHAKALGNLEEMYKSLARTNYLNWLKKTMVSITCNK